MDWKSLEGDLAKVAPVLGGLIGGPAGAGIGSLLASALGVPNTPSDVQAALKTDPEAAVKIKQIEANVQIAQITAETQKIAAASAQVVAVNDTLTAEAKGDSYWQKNHHAYESSFALLMVAAMYVGLPIAHIPVPNVDPMVWVMIGGILGVTAWQAGAVGKIKASQ